MSIKIKNNGVEEVYEGVEVLRVKTDAEGVTNDFVRAPGTLTGLHVTLYPIGSLEPVSFTAWVSEGGNNESQS